MVRALTGGVGHGVVVRRGGEDSGQRGAQAEDRPARCATSAAVVDGGTLSADLGAESGRAGRAAVAGASSQVSAGADADQEPAAGAGLGPGSATQVEAVERNGTGGVGETGVAALCRGTARAFAKNAGAVGGGDCGAEPAGGRGGEATASSGEVDDASGGRSGDGVGHGADAGSGKALRKWAPGGQLLRTDSARALQWWTAEVGTDQQAGQFVSALLAGGSGAVGGALRRGVGRFYRRLAVRKHRALAKVAVARKLAMRLYLMLREDWTYAQLYKAVCRQA